MPAQLVRDFLEETAQRQPEKAALLSADRRYSYSMLDLMADRLANALIEAGVKRGDRVLIFLPNCLEAVVSIFAVLKASASFVVINRSTKRDKLNYILRNCAASALVTDTTAGIVRSPTSADSQLPALRLIVHCGALAEVNQGASANLLKWEEAQARGPSGRPPRSNIDLDLACLIYTSGSTGEPKGVMSDHSNVVFAASSIIEYLGNVESDVVVNVLPLSFDYGLYQLLMTFKFGGTLLLERSFAYPADTLQRMAKEQVTGFPGVPTIYAVLLQMDLSGYDLASLRYLTNTAATLPTSHILAIRRKFPQARLFSMYGLTETKRTLYLPPEKLDSRPGSVGIPIPGTEAWIEDELGQRVGAGRTGELVVRGRHVMRGYWGDPDATSRRFRPGPIPGERVCHTEDLFRQDEEGYFYFVGRQDDIIKSRGEKVAPKEVENVLYALPGISEAVVIGVPDPLLGEAIKAILVVRDSSLTETRVLAHCRHHLEDFMVPQQVEFRDQLPKTASGKISKSHLRGKGA